MRNPPLPNPLLHEPVEEREKTREFTFMGQPCGSPSLLI